MFLVSANEAGPSLILIEAGLTFVSIAVALAGRGPSSRW
jgi:hypothetical protein